jgi:LacI family transcriptional regulator
MTTVNATGQRSDRPTVLIGLFESVNSTTMDGILAAAHEYGWRLQHLSFFDGFLPPDLEVHGVIDEHLAGESEVEHLREDGCPVVRLGKLPNPHDHLLPAVLPDYAAAGRLAAMHLAERGFRELGYVGYQFNEVAETIGVAFNERAEELGCTCHFLELGGEKERDRSRQELRRERLREWFTSRPKPFAVFTYSDHTAGQLCAACLSTGLSIPEDVAILGYGNVVHHCETAPVEISSVDANQEAFGREAARLLKRLMDGEPAPVDPIMVPPKAIAQRHSTDVLAVPNPVVARALRYIWDHFELSLSVIDIAREVGVSRSALDRAFRRYLGRTVNAELRRKRLERCMELLRSTDMPIADIAAVTGFPNHSYLYRTFQSAFGMTPRQFRLRR